MLIFSRVLIEKETHVYGFARSSDKLARVREELGELFHPVTADVRDEAGVKEGINKVLDEQGRIDVLVNNAGLGQFGPLDALTTEQWDVQMDTNLTGVFLCTRAVLATMKKQNCRFWIRRAYCKYCLCSRPGRECKPERVQRDQVWLARL